MYLGLLFGDTQMTNASVVEDGMIGFDYSAEAELFAIRSDIETATDRVQTFCARCDAVRFAIEELPPEFLLGTYQEVDEDRYDRRGIRRDAEACFGVRMGACRPVRRTSTGYIARSVEAA